MDAELKERAERFLDELRGDSLLVEPSVEALHDLLAEVRAETEARVVEAAVRAAEILARQRQGAWRVADAIRALAPADYVAVRREDLLYALEGSVMSGVDPTHPAIDRIRTALSRGST